MKREERRRKEAGASGGARGAGNDHGHALEEGRDVGGEATVRGHGGCSAPSELHHQRRPADSLNEP